MENIKKLIHSTQKKPLFVIVPIVITAIAAVIMVFLGKDLNKTNLEGQYQVYYSSTVLTLDQGTTLRLDNDSKPVYEANGSTISASNLPIYNTNGKEILLPVNMIYYNGQNSDCYTVDYFSSVKISDHRNITIEHDKNKVTADGGFLFDGDSLYIFFEAFTLEFDGFQYEFPAMSYVELLRGGFLTAFNFETKESVVETIEGDAVAKINGSGYQVSVRTDSLLMKDASKVLLFSRPELLEKIWSLNKK